MNNTTSNVEVSMSNITSGVAIYGGKDVLLNNCSKCMMRNKCPNFKTTYDNTRMEVIEEAEQAITHITNSPYISIEEKRVKIDDIKDHIDYQIDKKLDGIDTKCFYESIIIEDCWNDLNRNYNFEKNPSVKFLAEQIIKLQLEDFRLGMGFKKFGLMREIRKRVNGIVERIPFLTPGLHYSLEISRVISEIMEKMDKIVYGEKHININADIKILKQEDVWGDIKDITESITKLD